MQRGVNPTQQGNNPTVVSIPPVYKIVSPPVVYPCTVSAPPVHQRDTPTACIQCEPGLTSPLRVWSVLVTPQQQCGGRAQADAQVAQYVYFRPLTADKAA